MAALVRDDCQYSQRKLIFQNVVGILTSAVTCGCVAAQEHIVMVSSDFIKQLEGYGLTTAEILYHMPDHPCFLQTYVWQEYDLAPKFPSLRKFLSFWTRELEGPLHSIRVAHSKLIKPAEIDAVSLQLNLH